MKAVLKYLLFPGERGSFLLAHHPKMLSSTSTFGLSSQPLFTKQILEPPIQLQPQKGLCISTHRPPEGRLLCHGCTSVRESPALIPLICHLSPLTSPLTSPLAFEFYTSSSLIHLWVSITSSGASSMSQAPEEFGIGRLSRISSVSLGGTARARRLWLNHKLCLTWLRA